MRLFFAAELHSDVADALEQAITPLRALEPGLAWAAPDKRHLTLRFLGEVDDAALPALVATTDHLAATHRPFTMELAGIGGFPSLRRARVLWIGVQTEPRLELLHHDLELALETLGYELEGRPFRPHVTLARVRHPLDAERGRALARAARKVAFSATQPVAALTLFESVPGPTGSRYRRVHTATLGGR
jgi:2'-5' RNA ligase